MLDLIAAGHLDQASHGERERRIADLDRRVVRMPKEHLRNDPSRRPDRNGTAANPTRTTRPTAMPLRWRFLGDGPSGRSWRREPGHVEGIPVNDDPDDQRDDTPGDPPRGPSGVSDESADAPSGSSDPTSEQADGEEPGAQPSSGDQPADGPDDDAVEGSSEDGPLDGSFDADDFDPDDPLLDGLLLDEHELEHIRRDLDDLADFEAAFRPEGYRGVAVWCQDCSEEHFYPWDMLRENLQVLIETGETPVHEPAFAPEPERYVPWDYARGYVDALRDTGVDQRLDVDTCPRCRLALAGDAAQANYCPRCAAPLLVPRLMASLLAHGVDPARIDAIMRETGLPG